MKVHGKMEKNGYGKNLIFGGEILYEGEFKNNERNGLDIYIFMVFLIVILTG